MGEAVDGGRAGSSGRLGVPLRFHLEPGQAGLESVLMRCSGRSVIRRTAWGLELGVSRPWRSWPYRYAAAARGQVGCAGVGMLRGTWAVARRAPAPCTPR